VVRFLDRTTPRDAKIFAFRPLMEAYTSREVVVNYLSAPGWVMYDALMAAVEPDRQPTTRCASSPFSGPAPGARHANSPGAG